MRAEEELQKKDDEKARRDYIKNEYLRRKQLKLMDDMNDVIKPRSGSLKKKPRPKSIHRDVVESPKPPVRAAGEQPHARLLHNTSNSTNTLSHPDPWCCGCRGASSWVFRIQCLPGLPEPR